MLNKLINLNIYIYCSLKQNITHFAALMSGVKEM